MEFPLIYAPYHLAEWKIMSLTNLQETKVIKMSCEDTLPETNNKFAPKNRPIPKGHDRIPYPNHPFSGARMLLSGRVTYDQTS